MLDAVAGEGIRLPAWLARSLILGGHVLAAESQLGLGAPLNALNNLNRAQAHSGSESDASLEAWAAYLELIEDLEPDIVTAGARRLVSLGRGDLAATARDFPLAARATTRKRDAG